MSKTPEKFGTGSEEGIVASEAANNATVGGALIIALTLGIPGDAVTAVLLGLALLVVGNGLFKPNISTMVGRLYSDDSPLRDAGFNIFYTGINLGAMWTPIDLNGAPGVPAGSGGRSRRRPEYLLF